MTAKAIAAISNGPPTADATIHRMTNHDAVTGVACAVVRAVPHTISSTGSSGITPSSRPPMEIGTWCTPSHMLAIAPSVPVMSLLAMTSCSSVTAAMTINATTAGPNATRSRSRACRAPAAGLSCTRLTVRGRYTAAVRQATRRARVRIVRTETGPTARRAPEAADPGRTSAGCGRSCCAPPSCPGRGCRSRTTTAAG